MKKVKISKQKQHKQYKSNATEVLKTTNKQSPINDTSTNRRKRKVQQTNKEVIQREKPNIDPEIQKKQEERYYCTNPGLLEELQTWRQSANTCKKCGHVRKYSDDEKGTLWTCRKCGTKNDKEENGKITEKLGLMFIALAEKISNHSFFRNYSKETKEDMRSYAYEKLITGIKNYNFKYTNAFAYFSQACFNAFKTQLSKHYKQINIKRAMTKKAIVDMDASLPGSSMSKCLGNQFSNNDYDNFEEF